MYRQLSNIFKIFIFSPLFIYLGERSCIAYDEGFYILQAKWILDRGNWITPLWFEDISLDRTIGIQFLIALSQKIFGNSSFAIYIPSIISAILMAFLTYKIHRALLDDKYALISTLILSTTFLWINYANMATQDIVYSSIITLGIYSTIKANKTHRNSFFFLAGIWIGLAVMLKTFLTIIPFLGILPFLISRKIIFKKFFWLGFFIGFLPFFIWSLLILTKHGIPIYSNLFSKFINLSKNNNFTNPFYFYFWNIPMNIFPWSLFLFAGFAGSSTLKNQTAKYFLFFYPLFIIGILSIFSTKTPYYPLQITTLLSINCYLGISLVIQNKNFLISLFKIINFILIPITLMLGAILVNFQIISINIGLIREKYIIVGILLFSIIWLSFNFVKSKNSKLICIIIGPYLLFSTILQSGLITDRSQDLRIAAENLIKSEKLENIKINTITEGIDSEFSRSKIIKILTLMPKIGVGLKTLNNLESQNYAWTTTSKEEIKSEKELKLISKSEDFAPWNLVMKE